MDLPVTPLAEPTAETRVDLLPVTNLILPEINISDETTAETSTATDLHLLLPKLPPKCEVSIGSDTEILPEITPAEIQNNLTPPSISKDLAYLFDVTEDEPPADEVNHLHAMDDAAFEKVVLKKYIHNGLYIGHFRTAEEVKEAEVRALRWKEIQALQATIDRLEDEIKTVEKMENRVKSVNEKYRLNLEHLQAELYDVGLSKGIVVPKDDVNVILNHELLLTDVRFRNLCTSFRKVQSEFRASESILLEEYHRKSHLIDKLKISQEQIETSKDEKESILRIMEQDKKKLAIIRKYQADHPVKKAVLQKLIPEKPLHPKMPRKSDTRLLELMKESQQKAALAEYHAAEEKSRLKEKKSEGLKKLAERIKEANNEERYLKFSNELLSEPLIENVDMSKDARDKVAAKQKHTSIKNDMLLDEMSTRKRQIFERLEAESARVKQDKLPALSKLPKIHVKSPNSSKSMDNDIQSAPKPKKATSADSNGRSEPSIEFASRYGSAQSPTLEAMHVPLPRPKIVPDPLKNTIKEFESSTIGSGSGKSTSNIIKGRGNVAAFTTSPKEIIFKDYVPEQIYEQNVVFTNNSGQVNSLRLLPIDPKVLNFFEVSFQPPPRLSAGITCDMTVIFKPPPMFDKDIFRGEMFLRFKPEFGEIFHVILGCVSQKCQPILSNVSGKDILPIKLSQHTAAADILKSVSIKNASVSRSESGTRRSRQKIEKPVIEEVVQFDGVELHGKRRLRIDFGTCLVGSSRSRTVNLQNNGILGTDYEIHEVRSDSSDDMPTTINVFQITAGSKESNLYLPSYGNSGIEIRFSPPVPDSNCEFKSSTIFVTYMVTFSYAQLDPLIIECFGFPVDSPIHTDVDALNFDQVFVGQKYQQSFHLNSNHPTTVKYKVEIEESWMKSHSLPLPELERPGSGSSSRSDIITVHLDNIGIVDISPKFGFVQPGIPLPVIAKLRPLRQAYRQYQNEPFDVPLILSYSIGDVTYPLKVNLRGKLTTADVSLAFAEQGDKHEFDFGPTYITEEKITVLLVKNESHLAQKVKIVSNDSALIYDRKEDPKFSGQFLSLEPQEIYSLPIIFQPEKAHSYFLQLNVKSQGGSDMVASFRGKGVIPPVSLSPNILDFGTMAYGSERTLHMKVSISRKIQLLSSEELCLSFVEPILRSANQAISSEPALDTSTWESIGIKTEDIVKIYGLRNNKLYPGSVFMADICLKPQLVQKLQSVNLNDQSPTTETSNESTLTGSTFTGSISAQIPCHIYKRSRKKLSEDLFIQGKVDASSIKAQHLGTAFFEIQFQAEPEKFFVNKTVINFGDVPVGMRDVKLFHYNTVKSVNDTSLRCTSVLNPLGPFRLLKRPIKADTVPSIIFGSSEADMNCVHGATFAFSPTTLGYFSSTATFMDDSEKTELTITLVGKAVLPDVSVQPVGRFLDLGNVLVGSSSSATFSIINNSNFVLPCSCEISVSLPSLEHGIARTRGTTNFSGHNAFTVEPCTAELAPKSTMEFTVTFAPDRESDTFYDTLFLKIWGHENPHKIQLCGRAWTQSVVLGDYPSHPKGFLDCAYSKKQIPSSQQPEGVVAEGTDPNTVAPTEKLLNQDTIRTRYTEIRCPWIKVAQTLHMDTTEGQDGNNPKLDSWEVAPVKLRIQNLKGDSKGSVGRFQITKVDDESFTYKSEISAYVPMKAVELRGKDHSLMTFEISRMDGTVDIENEVKLEVKLANPCKVFYDKLDEIQQKLAEDAANIAKKLAANKGRRKSGKLGADSKQQRRGGDDINPSTSRDAKPFSNRGAGDRGQFDIEQPVTVESCFKIRCSGGTSVSADLFGTNSSKSLQQQSPHHHQHSPEQEWFVKVIAIPPSL